MKFTQDNFPKISVVTPSFNQSHFLEATIESILSQNYPNLEYIIIDGGSTDGSIDIIKKYEQYLYYWCSEPDSGQYDAINKGFAKSTGEIMAWLNSDDMYCSWALKTVASTMSELPQVEWLTTLAPGFWDWQGLCVGFGLMPGYSREAFLDNFYFPPKNKLSPGFIQQESTFWKRSLWEKVGGCIRTEFKLAGDFDLWSRFFLHADLYGIHSPLGGFRQQTNQRSRQIEKYIVEAEKSLGEMRQQLNWSENFTRKLLLASGSHKIPKIRKYTKNLYSYFGTKIVKEKLDLPDSFWSIKDYSFFV